MRIGIDARMYSTRFTGIGRYVKELIDNIALHTDLNRENLDIMHFTNFNAPIRYNKPSVVTIHDLTLSKFPGQKKTSIIHKLGYQMTIKSIINKAQKIICVSEHTKEDAIKMLDANVEKIRVVYEGISEDIKPVTDQTELNSIKKKYNINAPYFLYAGAWRKHKNLVNLVKAFNLYRNLHDTNCALVIAGKIDPNYKEVTDTIQEFGLASHVITPGFIPDEDLPALYSGANAFVFPSLYEGFGLPPLEAMACGCPVAVSNVSSLPEVCGNAAILFDPKDPNKICEAMHQVVEPETRSKMVSAGLEHVKAFSWADMATKILGIYKEVFDDIEKQKAVNSQKSNDSKQKDINNQPVKQNDTNIPNQQSTKQETTQTQPAGQPQTPQQTPQAPQQNPGGNPQ